MDCWFSCNDIIAIVLWVLFKNPPNIVRYFIRQVLTSSMRKLLTHHSSTSAERRFHEILKKYRIPFRSKVKIGDREIDFVIKEYAIDIDGHKQDVSKNKMLISKGYSPVHFNNNEIPNPKLIEWITKI